MAAWVLPAATAAIGMFTKAYESWQSQKNAEAQMKFQERMSNTAHQREMADLRKAGLNPLLSGKFGGASTPGGAMGSVPEFSDVINSATAVYSAKQDASLKDAQIRDVNSAATLKDAQTNDLNLTQGGRIDKQMAEIQNILQQERLSKAEEENLRVQLNVLKAQRDNIVANTASTIADTHKKKLVGKAYEAADKAVEGTKKKFKDIFKDYGDERFKRDPLKKRGAGGRW